MKKIFKCVVNYSAVAFSAFVGTLAAVQVSKCFDKKREQLGNEFASGLAELFKGFEDSQSAEGCCDDEGIESCWDGEGAESCCDDEDAESSSHGEGAEGSCESEGAESSSDGEDAESSSDGEGAEGSGDGEEAEGCCWENEEECESCTRSDCPKMAEK